VILLRPLVLFALTLVAASYVPSTRTAPRVDVAAVPDGGLQPQVAVDRDGTIHLIYFKGDAAHGDLFYTKRRGGAADFDQPIQITSVAGSAVAAGAVRGGRIALGRNGWVHVAWNGSTPIDRNGHSDTPMWYARISRSGRAESQRPIGVHTRHLDGGGDVAADGAGTVWVIWHAAGPEDGETRRRIYFERSTDEGVHFGREMMFETDGGNCGCCQLEAMHHRGGDLQLLFRSAAGGVHRDATWITVGPSAPSPPVALQPWELPACPMTTFALEDTRRGGLVAAWETAQQIYTATLDPLKRTVSAPSPMTGTGSRKHPSLAINAAGDRLYAWIDGSSFTKGGTLAWELRAADGSRLAWAENAGAVPASGLVAAAARPDGSFLILR